LTPVPESPRTELTGLGAQTVAKVSRRLVPFLLLLYTLAYLDRVNVGFASLEMTKELRFSNQVYGFGAGIFFLGYWLLEIPGAVLVERWSARKWISRIMLTWGAAAAATGLVSTAGEFYTARFVLGLAEAGFFPVSPSTSRTGSRRRNGRRRSRVSSSAARSRRSSGRRCRRSCSTSIGSAGAAGGGC
jgi:MFS family permease